MTMDNGEGRPLDEAEAGNDDPQGWYFDLPGGAWERQEEKNRTLRQRVLGNLSEDEAKARTEPFGRKPVEQPEKKPGRGLFGRRKKDDETGDTEGGRTSAGGTWMLNRAGAADPEPPRLGAADGPYTPNVDEEPDDDWTTEPTLKLTPFPRAEVRSEQTWGESDAGWDLGARATETDEAEPVFAAETEQPQAFHEPEQVEGWVDDSEADEGTKDFLASMRSWAHSQEDREPEEQATAFHVPAMEDEHDPEAHAPAFAFEPEQETVTAFQAEEEPAEEAHWATVPFDEVETEPESPSLTLRPRNRESSGKELDWNFGPAAWSDEPEPARREPLAFEPRQAEPAAAEPFAPDLPETDASDEDSAVAELDEPSDGMSFESMRKWAERNRDKDHPHFTTVHSSEEAPEPTSQAPIPLRPRAHEEGPTGPQDHPGGPPPLQLPIVLRSRDAEPQPADPSTSTKWNEFFSIPDAPAEGADGEDEQPSEGLAAMRAWAQKRAEPEIPEVIPEEFLKPFDWELEEDADTDPESRDTAPAEFLKPFSWETDESAEDGPRTEVLAAAVDSEGLGESEVAWATHPIEEASVASEVAVPEARVEQVEDDPLDGLFPVAAIEPAREEKKKPGRFGRLFGRNKEKAAEPVATEPEPIGDWLTPEDDETGDDVRVAASLADWAEDGGKLEAPESLEPSGEGWGASLTAGWARADRDAISEFSGAVHSNDAPEVISEENEWAPEAVASDSSVSPESSLVTDVVEPLAPDAPEAQFEAGDEDEEGWNPEPFSVPSFIAESVEAVQEPTVERAWEGVPTEVESVAGTPLEAVASVESVAEPVAENACWEAPADDETLTDTPVEAVASVEPVVEEPVVENAWWEAPTEDETLAGTPVEAVASVEPVSEEPVAENAWWEAPAVEDETLAETPVEAVASVEPVVEEPVAENAWWEAAVEDEPAIESPVEAVASFEPVADEPAAASAWWEATAEDETLGETPVEAVASVEPVVEEPVAENAWWEAAADEEPVVELPFEAVASVEPTVEEPVTPSAWWEAPADEPVVEAPVEAVASVEPVVEKPVAENAWWEAPAEDETIVEAPAEAVVSVEPVADEPVIASAWWEAAAEDEPLVEAPAEAVASVESVAEPVAENAWWEAPAEEAETLAETPVEAVASVEPVVEEPVAETAWWAAPAEEAETPVEAVASVEPVADEPVTASAWWEAPAEDETPVEAVASVEPMADEPVTASAWWEANAEDETLAETPVQAVASVEPVVEEPVAENAWWEAPAQDETLGEAPVEAVASVEPVVGAPVAEKAWWERPAFEDAEAEAAVPLTFEAEAADSVAQWDEPAPEVAEAVASAVTEFDREAEVPAESAASTVNDDDDPWADFVNTPAGGPIAEQPPLAASVPWRHEPVRPPSDDDMWGDIAARAEEAATADHQLDLAASLESQMAEEHQPAYHWTEPEEDAWETGPAPAGFDVEADEDVILAAFERHAATPDQVPVSRENDEVFAELLGTEAADIVAEADDEDGGKQSFIKMTGWAPQRGSFDGGWAPEQEVEEALSGSRPSAFGGNDGAGFAPPSWAVDELEGDAEAEAGTSHGHRTKTWIRELVETGLLALLVFLSVRASFQNFKVEGSSMYPTLENGQFLIVNKLVYSEVDMDKLSSYVPFVDPGSDPKRNVFHGPERGDIIVLKDPRDPETDLIKRVIGLPGETIEIVDGKVYINDRLLDEPYIKTVWHDTKPKIAIPPGEFFVMGDNRDNSLDSRSSQVGLVPQDLIIGKAMLSYWPRAKFGLAPNEEGSLGDEKPVLTTQRLGD